MENVNSYNYWLQVTVIGTGLDWGKLKAPPTQAVERPLLLPIRPWELLCFGSSLRT